VRSGSLASGESREDECAMGMSALCQKQTHALQQDGWLFGHPAGVQ
jgi:hypothetical protein